MDPKAALHHYLPDPGHPLVVTHEGYAADPQSDWWVPAEVSAAEVVDFYRAVSAFADATIAQLPLDAVGVVPWWPAGRDAVSLHRVIVHVVADTTRHAGHADILREGIDGAAGLTVAAPNLPEVDWPAYVARLTQVAERFEPRTDPDSSHPRG